MARNGTHGTPFSKLLNILPDRKLTPRNSIMLNHFSVSNLSAVVNRNKTHVIKSKCFTLKNNGQLIEHFPFLYHLGNV